MGFLIVLFIASNGELLVVNDYWNKSDRYPTLMNFKFDGKIGTFTKKEKEQFSIVRHLKGYPSDTNAWLRLILMETYDDDRLADKWFAKLRLYDDTVYTLFIIGYPDVSGHMYNLFRLSTHEDPQIMAIIKYAMSKYVKKRGEKRRYEQLLLKSIEYWSHHVRNWAALGEFYINEGRIEEGIEHIKQAINNVKVVYTDKNRSKYDKYNIQEFLNEHFMGIHISEAEYAELLGIFSLKDK